MSKTRGIVWFRNDLRIEDNEALHDALAVCDEILPVFIFDSRIFGATTRFGFPKIGIHRASFIIEAVHDLKNKFEQEYQIPFFVFQGKSEDVLFHLADEIKSRWIFCNRERTQEEVERQDEIERRLWTIGQEMRFARGKMLLYTSDLPFPVTHTPDRFFTFRKEVSYIHIRKPIKKPLHINAPTFKLESKEIPSITKYFERPSSSKEYDGGTTYGHVQLENLRHWIENRIGPEPVISPWLSSGCISPKEVSQSLLTLSSDHRSLCEEIHLKLLRRDHHRFMAKKYGNRIFQKNGVQRQAQFDDYDSQLVENWTKGEIGEPIIDAAMKALRKTGYLPHHYRRLVSSYFIQELKQDWRVGASWFESQLIDYDPCSNYGNWIRVAGIGASGKDELILNVEHQSKILDPEGEFVDKWLDVETMN